MTFELTRYTNPTDMTASGIRGVYKCSHLIIQAP
jgi:hypothetical protein